MPLVKIDGKELEVEAGVTVLNAAERLGIKIPRYCYHPALKIVASCRMCLVKIEGMPKLVPSCSTTINAMPDERKVDGKYDMVVTTNDKEVKDAQESIMEFLLLNHPVDCPECDQAGECELQDYSFKYGKGYSRFEFEKRVPRRKDLGPEVLLIGTRCILCSRCVRFTQEVSGTNELIVQKRGYTAEINTFPGVSLDNKLSMNVVDVCPVGALVSKDFLYKPRNWRYDKATTICPGCSVGCNIQVETLAESNEIYRIKPVENQDVNQWWMCDEGRLLYHQFAKLPRLEYPAVRENKEMKRTNWRNALKSVADNLQKFKGEEIAVVGNGYATNEENYLIKKVLAKGLGIKTLALSNKHKKEEDAVYPKFVVKGEKLPNLQGAQDTLGKTVTFDTVLKHIDKGEIKALFFLGGDPNFTLNEKEIEIVKKLDFLAVQDIASNPLTELAHVVLAGSSAYEKEGTFTNHQGRVQRIRPVVMPPHAARPDYDILRDLGQLLQQEVPVNPKKAFGELSGTISGYGDMTLEAVKSGGALKTTAAGETAAR